MFADPKKLAITFVLSLFAAYFGMRFGMLMDMRGGMAEGFVYASQWIGRDLVARPLAIAFGSNAGLMAIVGFIVPWAVFAYLASQEGNFDPGKEHGDAKWADAAETKSLADTAHVLNNRVVSAMHWQVLNRRGEGRERARISKKMNDRNANLYVLGTSGSRKTVGVVKPAVLNAIDEKTAVRLLEEIGDKKGLAALGRGVAASPDAECCGCDLFLTDPKGGVLAQCGGLLDRAEFELRCFNSVDFSRSGRCNPIAYIPVREVDASDPFALDMYVSVEVDGEDPRRFHVTANGTVDADVEKKDEPPVYLGAIAVGPVVVTLPRPEFVFDDRSIDDDIDVGSLTPEQRAEYVEAGLVEFDPELDDPSLDPSAKTAEELKAWTEYKQMIHGISYRKSKVRFGIGLSNPTDDARRVRVAFDLPLAYDFRKVFTESELRQAEMTWTEKRRAGLEKYERYEYVAYLGSDPEALLVDERGRTVGPVSEDAVTIDGGPRIGRAPDGIELVSIVNCLVKNFVTKQDKNTDPFWDNAEMLLFQALIAYQIERWDDPKYWTLPEVMDMLMAADVSMDKSAESDLDRIMRSWETGMQDVLVEADANVFGRKGKAAIASVPTEFGPHSDASSIAVHCYKCFKQAAPETMQSILISCNNTLVKLFNPQLRDILSADELELDAFGDPNRKQALFLICADDDDTYDFLAAVITFLAIKYSCRNAYRKYGGSLPRQLQVVFDEFANIGVLPNFPRTIAVTRSRNIAITICVQSMSQATKNYSEEDAITIQNNCSTLAFMAGSDEKTLEAFQKLIGDETVHEKTRSETKGQQHSRTESRQSMARPLCSVSTLRKLDTGECVLLVQGLEAIKDKKYPLAEHPLYPFIDPGKSSEQFRAEAGDKDPEASASAKKRFASEQERREDWERRKRKYPRAHCVFDREFDFVPYRNARRREKAKKDGQGPK